MNIYACWLSKPVGHVRGNSTKLWQIEDQIAKSNNKEELTEDSFGVSSLVALTTIFF